MWPPLTPDEEIMAMQVGRVLTKAEEAGELPEEEGGPSFAETLRALQERPRRGRKMISHKTSSRR